MSRYPAMFKRLRAESAAAFIPFVVLGDPDLKTSREIIETLISSGVDALELGIPFSDPIADGPTIQQAAVRALEGGVTPQQCWTLLEEVRAAHPDVPIGLLVYANLVAHARLDRFYARAAEAEPFAQAARDAGVDPVLIAPPNASDDRLRRIAALSAGYTYVVTRAGVTGAEQAATLDRGAVIERLIAHGAPPPVVGFGISTPEHVRAARALGAAGAISGSAVVARISEHLGDPARMHDALSSFARQMRAGAR
ncbi:MAG: tryptophan synthase subunit alpha [Proteobacteria bacterium]|nr:tryptophan synthase subunit alpha [Pseudomonadota bacterium]